MPSESNKQFAALMFTDLVGSVALQQRLGTAVYMRFVARHDEIFQDCLAGVPDARVLNETGDGFLVRFDDPSDAVNTALRLQWRLKDEVYEGEAMRVRIGLHLGMVTEMDERIRGEKRAVGMPINLTARIMDLAGGGQILMTRTVYEDARNFVRSHPVPGEGGNAPVLHWQTHGFYEFKGNPEGIEIFEVGAEGLAPFLAPEGGGKAVRVGARAAASVAAAAEPAILRVDSIRESDVYISYAPVDNRPLASGQEGWISQFHRNLEIRIEQLSGEAIRVVERPPVEEAAVSEELIGAVPGAKAMVTVVSPPFVKSRNCIREAETFWRSAHEAGNFRLDHRTRMLKVVKTPVAPADVPDALGEVFSNLLSFDFFMRDPESGRMWELDETFGVQARRRYYERIYDLAWELCHLLRAFQSGPQRQAETASCGRTVYLAETTSDLQEARDRLKRELLEHGHTVLPDRPLPLNAVQLELAVLDCLRRCEFAVHPVGSIYGMVPEQSEHSVVELQDRIASRHARETGALTRLIWLPRERAAPEPRQADFIRHLMEHASAQSGTDLIEESLEAFKAILTGELNPAPAQIPEAPRAESAAPLIYLICDPADEAAVEPLEDYLYDQGFDVTTPHFDGSESDVAAHHRRNLVRCDAALIYYGAGSKGWVESKLMDVQQAAGFGRERPLQARIVYVAPPLDRRKERFRTHQAQVVRPESVELHPLLLSAFVEQLKSLNAGL